MFEVSFKVQHDCPYTRFTMKHPDVRMIEWCNNKIHVMEVDCPDIETFTRIEPDLSELLLWKGGKVLKKNFLSGNLQLIVKTCRCCKIKSQRQRNRGEELVPADPSRNLLRGLGGVQGCGFQGK